MRNTKQLQLTALEELVDDFRRSFPVADISDVERDLNLTKKKMEASANKMKKVRKRRFVFDCLFVCLFVLVCFSCGVEKDLYQTKKKMVNMLEKVRKWRYWAGMFVFFSFLLGLSLLFFRFCFCICFV